MLITKKLTIKEYEKALMKSKKEDVVSIALHHIRKSRALGKKLGQEISLDEIYQDNDDNTLYDFNEATNKKYIHKTVITSTQ